MRDVLAHEVAHVLRGDHRVVLLQELVRASYWPIVPVHGLIRELGRAREELCDNHVLRNRDALSYGETLLHLAELSFQARAPRASVGILHWKGELERRIAGLLDRRRSTMTVSSRSLACLVALSFVACGTIASTTRFTAASGREDPSTKGPQGTVAPAKEAPKVVAEAKRPREANRSMLIHVVGPDGRPMPGARVHQSVWAKTPDKTPYTTLVTDDRGEVRFEVPDNLQIYRLWAQAKGHVPLFAHWEEQDNPEETLPGEFTFRLKRGTVIGGLVRDEAGQPIEGVAVEVSLQRGGKSDGNVSPDTWLATGKPTTQQGVVPVTDAQGRWTLDNVPEGDDLEILLKLDHPDYIADPNWGTSQKEQGVDLAALRARTATIKMRGGLSASGTITDPEGKPVAGAIVVRGDRPYWDEGSQEVRTDEKGLYRLPPQPRGPLTITVVAKGWRPALRKVEIAPEMKPFDFRLEPGRDLRLRFVDPSGVPVPSVYVSIDKWRRGESLYNMRHPNVLDTQIPNRADDAGLYRWDWAPDDAVAYRISKPGYAEQTLDLTADGKEQALTLPKVLRISGKVTDARTGRAVARVSAIPVIEFSPGHLIAQRQNAKKSTGEGYAIECDRTDVAHRVRIEAEGYRSAISDAVKVGAPSPTFDFRLEPAAPSKGRVVDSRGRAIKGARVYLATHSQNLSIDSENENAWPSNQCVITDEQGGFSLPAQFERYAVVAIHDDGYAETDLDFNHQPGEMTLRAWARVEGRLVRAGRPVPAVWISFEPLRLRSGSLPHIQDHFSTQTDRDGRFVFPRVPPVKSSVRAQLSPWRDSPLTSSRSVPLDLQPGERAEVDLGGRGTTVKGRVVLTGQAAMAIDLHKSLNWLLRKSPGIEPPAELRGLGFDARSGWNNAWTSTQEGNAFIQTLDQYFVTLGQDGSFEIGGVPAGDYDFAIRLYEPPAGNCLVSPVGSRIVPFRVTEEAARGASLELGEIEVKATPGPRIGEVVPDITADTLSGGPVNLADLRGRYVLLDFWATWCGACVSDLPALRRLHDTYGTDKRLAVLGINIDEDRIKAQGSAKDRNLPGMQGFLGGQLIDQVLTRYAISSVPTYLLIDPDGKLVQRSASFPEIEEVIRRTLP